MFSRISFNQEDFLLTANGNYPSIHFLNFHTKHGCSDREKKQTTNEC